MGLNMAITELDSGKALCKGRKLSTVKVFLDDPSRWDSYVEVERIVDLKKAAEKLGKEKMDAFLKKSRLKVEGDELYLEKVKDPVDQKMLSPFVKELKTKWVLVEKVPSEKRKELIAGAKKENTVTEWDLLEFDEMYSTCAKCGMSWDNKKGCVGNFGPSGSPVPELAKKHGLAILSKVEELAEKKTVLTSKDAEKLLEEVKVLREKAPAEGKVIVRRIEGTLNRLEAMAKCSKDYNVGFYFF
ncbi:MAG: hypothetical protein A3K67_03575 [Euryarchaeota archaeon RBG_16_62_10]|nr:MAG: hypothetical protein A3K67_03575 [Euryarchaeota archaeon RBG_16_62_10]